MHLEERYLEAMGMYHKELEDLRDRYNEERQTPLLPRNMPPVSGRIMWVRHLYRRMEESMEIFITKSRVMKHRNVQKCIQLYNALAIVFVHYEQIYHEAWYKFAGQVFNLDLFFLIFYMILSGAGLSQYADFDKRSKNKKIQSQFSSLHCGSYSRIRIYV